jgi:hypothetical protein
MSTHDDSLRAASALLRSQSSGSAFGATVNPFTASIIISRASEHSKLKTDITVSMIMASERSTVLEDLRSANHEHGSQTISAWPGGQARSLFRKSSLRYSGAICEDEAPSSALSPGYFPQIRHKPTPL